MRFSFQYPVVYFYGDDLEEDRVVTQREGYIKPINIRTEPYEASVSAEGYEFHLIFGSQRDGMFLCIPNWHMGCELSYLNDIFWNHESILGNDQIFGYENATAIAYALSELKSIMDELPEK